MREVDYYLALPWTVRVEHRTDDGEYLALFVDELEGFVVTGRTPEEVNEGYWDGLEFFLQSFLDDGNEIPLPEGVACQPVIVEEVVWAPSVPKRRTASGGSCVPSSRKQSHTRTGSTQEQEKLAMV